MGAACIAQQSLDLPQHWRCRARLSPRVRPHPTSRAGGRRDRVLPKGRAITAAVHHTSQRRPLTLRYDSTSVGRVTGPATTAVVTALESHRALRIGDDAAQLQSGRLHVDHPVLQQYVGDTASTGRHVGRFRDASGGYSPHQAPSCLPPTAGAHVLQTPAPLGRPATTVAQA
ncbi:hypothetical protein BD626DRAFT_506710 [Schizophyllum amplum]|uniref:Uncharacterized protein n=1 Tax=Schizophyllum amplum TaxID=97359 RepID=A0A550C510_9AGAR|nr:hypothetical protein BD626DRAFT_506710 [Auriculariopsis ampla]